MNQRVYHLCLEICRIVYLNVLWFIFTLMGGIVFGVFPATAALFAIYRQRLKGEDEFQYGRAFWIYYKKSFVEVNIAAIVFLLAGFVLYFEYRFSGQLDASGASFLFQVMVKVSIVIYFMTMIFFFPVFVHFDVKKGKMFLQPFLMIFFSPIQSIGIIVTIVLCSFLYYVFPGLMVLFCLSLPAGIIMQVMYKRFLKLSTLCSGDSTAAN